MSAGEGVMRRGSPLAMLAMLMAVWVGGRALTWENPFPLVLPDIIGEDLLFAEAKTGRLRLLPGEQQGPSDAAPASADPAEPARYSAVLGGFSNAPNGETADAVLDNALGHQLLWLRAIGAKLPVGTAGGAALHALQTSQRIAGVTPLSPPVEQPVSPDRWSVDAWAFWRQGSNAAPISQGRVPIYGASQVGANLQYRFAPASSRDPRLYLRAYRALISGGETELAAGVSARPIGAVPVRVAAELRAVQNDFGTEARPAIIAVTELPPQGLPAAFRLEAYGGAGYVGGKDATPFADGQVALTRELASFDGPSDTRARLSLGAGAWGGAQKDASRVDVGPTMRVDLKLGEVPARISVDWREQVGGDAAPRSGVAATLSTRF